MKVKEIRRKLSKYGTFYFHPSFQNGLSTRVLPVPRQILRIAQPTDEDLGKKIFFLSFQRYVDFRIASRACKSDFSRSAQRPYTKYYIGGKKRFLSGSFYLRGNPQNASCISVNTQCLKNTYVVSCN